MRAWRRLLGLGTGALLALLPVIALAQEEGGRTLERSADWGQVMLVTLAGMAALMLLATFIYLYRMRRSIVWGFQRGRNASRRRRAPLALDPLLD